MTIEVVSNIPFRGSVGHRPLQFNATNVIGYCLYATSKIGDYYLSNDTNC